MEMKTAIGEVATEAYEQSKVEDMQAAALSEGVAEDQEIADLFGLIVQSKVAAANFLFDVIEGRKTADDTQIAAAKILLETNGY